MLSSEREKDFWPMALTTTIERGRARDKREGGRERVSANATIN